MEIIYIPMLQMCVSSLQFMIDWKVTPTDLEKVDLTVSSTNQNAANVTPPPSLIVHYTLLPQRNRERDISYMIK